MNTLFGLRRQAKRDAAFGAGMTLTPALSHRMGEGESFAAGGKKPERVD